MNAGIVTLLVGTGALLGGCYPIPGQVAADGGTDVLPVCTDAALTDAHGDAGVDSGGVVHETDGGGVPVFTLDAGTTWTSLYRDYFGPTGVASCTQGTLCHGATTDEGYMVSHYLCPNGDDPTGCYQGFTSRGDGGANLITPDASFKSDLISTVLCQPGGAGVMPYGCSYEFTPVDIERISDWVTAGAPDN